MELIAKLDELRDVVEREKFKSRKVWITIPDEKYPQTVEIELQQDKVDLLNNTPVGSEVKLYLNLRGRKWTNPEGKTSVFNSLVCWKVEVLQAASGAVKNEGIPVHSSLHTTNGGTGFAPAVEEESSDLPF